MVMHVMQMIDSRRWDEKHATVKRHVIKLLGEDTRVAHVVGSAKSNCGERSPQHEESEWSLTSMLT